MVKFLLGKLKSNFLIPVGLMLLYLLLPTVNSGIDGYAYASAIRWGHELVWPHHLLYVPFGRFIFSVVPFIQPLVLMKLVNALAAGMCLFIFQRILKELKINYTYYFVLFVGSCFGMMRYATENETYILPLLCSLLGTLYFIKNLKLQKNSNLIFSGLWFGVGVLFHQIHGLWYLGFAIPLLANLNFKKAFVFLASGGLLVISVYLLAYNYSKTATGIIQFILHDVYAGQVNTSIGLNNFIMTPISFIRTFIQVHGYMKPLLMANPVLFVLPIAFLIIGFVSIKTIIKYSTKQVSEFGLVSKAVFWAFILQFCFAFYSVGNAEFMVMLPLLIVLWLVLNFDIPTKPIYYISLLLLFWNLVFGLSPTHFLDLDGSKQLMAKMEKYPNAKWIVDEPQKMENMLDYYNGVNSSNSKMIRPFINDTLQITLIENLAKTELLTNCFNNGRHFGRQSLTITSHDFDRFDNFNHTGIDSVKYFGGKYFIEKLSAEPQPSYEKIQDSYNSMSKLNSTENKIPPDGHYRYDIAFAEWDGNSMGEKVTVIIKGDSIKVVYEGDGKLTFSKKGDILDQGIILKHKSGVWIIAHNKKDTETDEIGGCSDGPTIIDFMRKKYWMC